MQASTWLTSSEHGDQQHVTYIQARFSASSEQILLWRSHSSKPHYTSKISTMIAVRQNLCSMQSYQIEDESSRAASVQTVCCYINVADTQKAATTTYRPTRTAPFGVAIVQNHTPTKTLGINASSEWTTATTHPGYTAVTPRVHSNALLWTFPCSNTQ